MAFSVARLAKLNSLTAEELDQLEDDIRAEFEAADAADNMDRMEEMVAALETVTSHRDSVQADAETETETETEPEAPVAEVEAEAEVEIEVETEATVTDITPAPASDEESHAMAASADTPEIEFEPPADRAPIVASASVAVVAGADVPGVAAGSEFRSEMDIADAMSRRIQSLGRGSSSGDGDQHTVASIVASFPEDRVLLPGDVTGNATKIEAVTGRQALVASGGYCAPLQVKYDIFGLGSTARPVRDALAAFNASRGGIRYVTPPKLGDDANAVGVWTAANDASPSAPTTKASLTVACAAEVTATADAVTLQLQFGNLMSRAYPELVARHNSLSLVEHARLAEQTLLTKIGTASTAITSAYKLGTSRDFLLAAGKAAAAYRARHRMLPSEVLRAIVPIWVRDAIREDIARGLPGDQINVADALIDSFFSARNIAVTWHLDGTFASQSAGAIVDFPSTIVWYLFAEGTFLFLDGGTLDIGIVRDSTLVGTNDYKMFLETFEGVAKVGVESIKITTTTQVNGATVGTLDPASA
jgi:hypothetical protein